MAGLWPRMQSKDSKNVQGTLLSPVCFYPFCTLLVAVLSKPASFISLAILSICTIKSPLLSPINERLSPINECAACAEQK